MHSLGGFYSRPIRPERVQTVEFGYRSTLFDKLYLDASLYLSLHRFYCYQTGASFAFGGKKVAEEDVIAGWASNVGDTIVEYNNLLINSIQVTECSKCKDKVNLKALQLD